MINKERQIMFSGIMPTGNIHIGNYLGAIEGWVQLQKSEWQLYIMIADLHAITTPQDPLKLSKKTLEVAMLLVACGIDPKKTILFVQSHVPAHTELAWILNTITPLGELNRMTQFKEKRGLGAMAGLLNYPVLQAADILLYKPRAVPVGEDQFQHLELTRTLVQKFNSRFGDIFSTPLQKISDSPYSKIMGLDDPSKKMSKSASSPNNYIALLDSHDEIRRKIKLAVTDSENEIRFDPPKKPAISNLINIYSGFSGKPPRKIEHEFVKSNYTQFKDAVTELLIERLTPIQKQYKKISESQEKILVTLRHGAENANTLANKTLFEVKRSMGLVL